MQFDVYEEDNLEQFEELTKIALVDADSVAYASACISEYADDLLPRAMYSEEEWNAVLADPQYDLKENCIWKMDMDNALIACRDKIAAIMRETRTVSAELHFSTGKNFRYTVDPLYKNARKGTRYPPMLREIKEALLEEYEASLWTEVEADDVVVKLMDDNPDKYVLCAIDKDVYKNVAGTHWNYFHSARFNIDPKWVTTTAEDAKRFPYLQCMAGDSTDSIVGIPGIGPKKAEKILVGATTHVEMWQAVVKGFAAKGLDEKEAIKNMRLVNLRQLCDTFSWDPWVPPRDWDN